MASIPASGAPEEGGPWGEQTPDYHYAFRGLPLSGSIALQPRGTELSARCSTEVVLASEGGSMVTNLWLEPRAGTPDTIDLLLAASRPGTWQWKTERGSNSVRGMQRLRAVEAVQRLGILGGRHPLVALAGLGDAFPHHEVWRLTLARPLREPLLLQAKGSLPVSASGSRLRWEVPLPAVLGAVASQHEAMIHRSAVDVTEVRSLGLTESPAPTPPRGSSPWKGFVYGGGPVALSLSGQKSAVEPAFGGTAPLVEHASLISSVSSDGRHLHRFQFRVRDWRQRTFPIHLPPGARCQSVRSAGRWVVDLPAVESASGPLLHLPVEGGKGSHSLEVVYETEQVTGTWWARVTSPVPQLPIHMLALERTWLLPPGFVPFHSERYHQLPGSRPVQAGGLLPSWSARREQRPRAVLDVPSLLLAASQGFPGDAWEEAQARLVQDACQASEQGAGKERPSTLGESLEVVEAALREQATLILDAHALKAAGLSPDTPLPPRDGKPSSRSALQPPRAWCASWEMLELVYVPCPSGPLLTTAAESRDWLRTVGDRRRLSEGVEAAVAEAVLHGRDSSGRFWKVADWIERASKLPGLNSAYHATDHEPGWTAWQALPGGEDVASLSIIRPRALVVGGLLLAALFVLVLWMVQRRPGRGSFLCCLGGLALAGLAAVWLPPALRVLAWPALLAAVGAAFLNYLRPPAAMNPASVAAAALALALAVGGNGIGQPAAPHMVYLVPAPADMPEKATVLVAPELLQRLQELAAQGADGLRQPVILGARYEGDLTGGAAEFKATFQVHSFVKEAMTLHVPLSGVQLKNALVDGTAAHPVAQPPPKEGFSLEVAGRGLHFVELHFTAAIAGTAADRSVRFAVPELLQSRLVAEVPAGSRYLYAVAGRGRQSVTPASDESADRPVRLDAELGRVSSVHLRWRQDEHAPAAAMIQASETYLWKLHSTSSSLQAVFQYVVKRGATTALTLELPELLEVRTVEAGRLPGAATEEAAPRLQDWSIAGRGNQRRLRLDFQRPLTTGVQVILELVPRAPLGTNFALVLPAPLNVQTVDGLLAYRTEDLRAQAAEYLRVNGRDPRSFVKAWKALGMADPGLNVHAYSFHRATGGTPYIKLMLAAAAAEQEAVQQIAWQVGARQADLEAEIRVTSRARDLVMLEWEVPGSVAGLDVQGEDVHSWSRVGSRVQIWLRRPTEAAEFRLTGWQPLEAVKGTAKDPPHTLFRLAPIAGVDVRRQTMLVRIAALGGLSLSNERLKDLFPLPEPRPSERDLGFVTQQRSYGGTFQVREVPARFQARTLTFAEFADQGVQFSAVVDCQVRQGELRTLTVKLLHGAGEDLQLQAEDVVQVRETRDAQGKTWVLTLPDGVTDEYRVRLTGRIPIGSAAGVRLPAIVVPGATTMARWVAVAGRELRPDDARGLKPVTDVAAELRRWPAEADRVRRAGAAWRVEANDWQLRLVPRAEVLDLAPLRVLRAEHRAGSAGGRGWWHRSVYHLFHDRDAELRFKLPEGASLVALLVDGAEVTPSGDRPGEFWLPFTEERDVRRVEVRWSFEPGRESVVGPDLNPPVLDGAGDAPACWVVYTPTGYRLVEAQGAEPGDGWLDDLHRVKAQLRLIAILTERARDRKERGATTALAEAQESFYRRCRSLESYPPDSEVAQQVRQLLQQNQHLAATFGLEDVRARAAKRALTPARARAPDTRSEALADAGDDDLVPHGLPTYWEAAAGQVPHLRLEPVAAGQRRQAWERTLVYLVALLGIFALSLFPRLLGWVRFFWPEQMALLGYGTLLYFGPGWIGLFFLLFGMIGRVVTIAQGLGTLARYLTRNPVAPANPPTASS